MVEEHHVYLVTGLQHGQQPAVHAVAVLTHSHQRAIELFRKRFSGAEIYSCTSLAEAREVVKTLEAAKMENITQSDILSSTINDL